MVNVEGRHCYSGDNMGYSLRKISWRKLPLVSRAETGRICTSGGENSSSRQRQQHCLKAEVEQLGSSDHFSLLEFERVKSNNLEIKLGKAKLS